ncbi:hypothetical protein PIB30_104439 [Stylosanthes scabra]|uniref:Uncharacterized protein n=1 Tax=Stylosanthes scabra TaxID=79078 RepID=A0ABU6SYJ1_9FABA|nr:hypothetical protein [Stylosanthes scabra]
MVGAFSAPLNASAFNLGSAYQGRRLFDECEESIQEFKWHYFKVLPLPGTRPFWVDDEGKPYPWVYWNSEARECRVMAFDPLETLAFYFLQSLPVGLGKRSNFRCCWILDHSDAEVGAFLAKDGGGGQGGSTLRSSPCPGSSDYFWSLLAASSPFPVATKKGGSSKDPAGKPFPVQGEEGAKEDPSADLKKKGRKRKAPGASAEEAALGADSSWVHKVSSINRAFPDEYNFREALDAGLTNGPTREILGPLVPEQLLGTAQHLACQLTACLQVSTFLCDLRFFSIFSCFSRCFSFFLLFFVFLDWDRESFCQVQMEKELAFLKDQVDVLTAERDLALAAPLLNAEIKSLTQQLRFSEGERLSALARMTEVEERAKVQAAELESCRADLLKEKKGAEGLTKSLREKQTALDGAEETGDMVQETFEILMD